MAYGLQSAPADYASPSDVLVSENNEELVMSGILPSSPHVQTKLQKEGKHGPRQAGKSETHIDLRRLIEGSSQSKVKSITGNQGSHASKHSKGAHSIDSADFAIQNPTNILRQYPPSGSRVTSPQNNSFVKRP